MYPLHLEKQVERTFIAAFRSRAEPLIRQIIAAARDHLRPVLSVSGDMVVRADGIGDLIRFMEDLERQNPGGISQEELESAIRANYRMIEAAAKAETDKAWRQVQKDRGREIAKTETPLRSSNPEADEFLKERARAGMQMLEDLTGEHRRQVFDIVYESVRNGDTLKTITEKLKNATGASESRAAFWAQDQAGDVHAQLTRIRQKEAGFAGYVWRTMKDARVRDSHIENHGKYFDWSIGATNLEKPGARHPGEDWRCRCYAAPAFGSPSSTSQEAENQQGTESRIRDRRRVQIEASTAISRIARTQRAARPQSTQIVSTLRIRKHATSQTITKLFGQQVSDEDLARLAGAHGAELVDIVAVPQRGIEILVRAEEYQAKRRIFGEAGALILENAVFRAAKTGTGIGLRLFSQQVQYAKKLGVQEIRVLAYRAPGWNGYYTWARFGYDGPIPANVFAVMPIHLRSARTVQELMALPGGKEFWKVNGDSYDGVFDLRKGSRSLRVLSSYMKEKEMDDDSIRADSDAKDVMKPYPSIADERFSNQEYRLEERYKNARAEVRRLEEEYNGNPTDEILNKIRLANIEANRLYGEYAEFVTSRGFA